MNQFCLITFSFNYFEVCLALSFWFFLVEVVSVNFDIQTDLKMKHLYLWKPIQKLVKHPRQKFLHKQRTAFSFQPIFAKSFILDVLQDSAFACKASYDFSEKVPSQTFDRVLNLSLITSKNLLPLIIFPKVLPICLLNLINISVLCTVKST